MVWLLEEENQGKPSDAVVVIGQVLSYNQVSMCLFTDTCDRTFLYVSAIQLLVFVKKEYTERKYHLNNLCLYSIKTAKLSHNNFFFPLVCIQHNGIPLYYSYAL